MNLGNLRTSSSRTSHETGQNHYWRSRDKLARLDAAIVRHNAPLPPLEEFVLPGGTHSAALCPVARSVARRAKRDYFHLMRSEATSPEGSRYLNRLSDQLFVPSRTLNRTAGQGEILWKRT